VEAHQAVSIPHFVDRLSLVERRIERMPARSKSPKTKPAAKSRKRKTGFLASGAKIVYNGK